MPKNLGMEIESGRLGLRGKGFLESHGPALCSRVLSSAATCWQDPSELWDPTQQRPGKEKQLRLHAHLGPPKSGAERVWEICSASKVLPNVVLDKHLLKYSIHKLSLFILAAGASLPQSGSLVTELTPSSGLPLPSCCIGKAKFPY